MDMSIWIWSLVLLLLGVVASACALVWGKPIRLDKDPDDTPVIVEPDKAAWRGYRTTIALVLGLLLNTAAALVPLLASKPQ
jgi:ABC-type Fe3+ transport system permease subunit